VSGRRSAGAGAPESRVTGTAETAVVLRALWERAAAVARGEPPPAEA
jgi:hypothetical protein